MLTQAALRGTRSLALRGKLLLQRFVLSLQCAELSAFRV
jgi:hypothetical protein